MASPLERFRQIGTRATPGGAGLSGPLQRFNNIQELQGRAAELTALQQATGAPGIEQESPGLFRRVIDILSRPEFTIAGIVEEIGTGGSVGDVLGRAGTELFSGIGGLRGEKHGFSEALEELGVGDLGRVSDLIPQLEGTIVDFTGRGTIGLMLAIAFDPLTYLGGPGATRLARLGGVKAAEFASKKGMALLGKEIKGLLPERAGKLALDVAPSETREAALQIAREEVVGRMEKKLDDSLAKFGIETQAQAAQALKRGEAGFIMGNSAGARAIRELVPVKALDPAKFTEVLEGVVEREASNLLRQGVTVTDDLFYKIQNGVRVTAEKRVLAAAKTDPSLLATKGLTFMGRPIPGTPGMVTAMSGASAKLVEAIGTTRAGASVLAAGASMKTAFDSLGSVFFRDFKTRGVAGFNILKQVHIDGHGAMVGRIHLGILDGPAGQLARDPVVMKRVVRAVDNGTVAALEDPAERAAAAWLKETSDAWVLSEVRHGFLSADRVRPNYIAHFYENSPEEIAMVVGAWKHANINKATIARHAEERTFATLDEAVEVSTRLNKSDPNVPILRPLYDPVEIMRRRGETHADALAFQEWYQTVAKEFSLLSKSERVALVATKADTLRDVITTPLGRADETVRVFRAVRSGRENLRPFDHVFFSRKAAEEFMDSVAFGGRRGTVIDQVVSKGDLYRGDPAVLNAASDVPLTSQARAQMGTPKTAEARFVPAGSDPLDSKVAFLGTRYGDVLAEVERKFPVASREMPFEARDALELARPALNVVDDATKREFDKITAMVRRGRTNPDDLLKLSGDGRKEFLRQRFLKSSSREELANTIHKYWDYVDDFPKGRGVIGELAEDGTPFVQITLPGLLGKEIPKSIADDLAQMSETVLNSREVGKLTQGYDRLNNFFKRMVTIYFPSFTFRNMYSNVGQTFYDISLGALDPRYHKEVVRILGRLPDGKHWIKDGIIKTDLGEQITYNQFRKEIAETGVRVDPRAFLELTGRQRDLRDSWMMKRFGNAFKKGAVAVENEARVLHYLQLRRRGLGAEEAAARMKKFLFDYSNLAPVEAEIFRRVLPFYVWTRKNIELQLRTLATRPGRVINLVRPFRGRDEENQQMVAWEGEALKLRLDRNGKTVRMLTGVDLPVRGLDLIWKGTLSSTFRQALGMVSPLLKAPVEIGAGVNLFKGQGLSRQQSGAIGRMVEPMPASIKNFMGYKKTHDAAGRPNYTFDGERFYLLFQSYAFSRFVSTTDRQFREFLNTDEWSRALLDVATGLRLKDLNMDDQQMRMLRERIRQTERSLVRRGAKAEFTKTFTPRQQGQLQ